ncbi:MAG: HTTM domain-containing protein [Myxococcales bacterium FL481]|nr:MAG: HTTM domain-containing protein [Myxococcales bacterium FL481]
MATDSAARGEQGRPGMALRAWLSQPVDAAGVAAFRILFGAALLLSTLRFAAYGWIRELYIDPVFHFSYRGFEWVRPWPAPWLYLHFVVIGASALAVAVGWRTRWAAGLFCLAFTYVELLEKAAYLNHYYLVSLMAALLIVVPSASMWSLDARRLGSRPLVARWCYLLLGGQVAVVYSFAGVAKIGEDWLLHAEPLRTWLQAYADLPFVGPWLATPFAAYAMSWFGCIYDLSIVGWLLWRPSRPFALLAVFGFHGAIWILFPVGVFSLVMVICASLLCSPSWPRRFLGRHKSPPSQLGPDSSPQRLAPWAVAAILSYLGFQIAWPLRHFAIPGDVNWSEEGFRFAWRVMLVEKSGQVEFRVHADGEHWIDFPREQLTPLQHKMMSTAPDMIHEYALHLAQRLRARGHREVQVYADAYAALNGRPSQRLIDPTIDLAAVPRRAGSGSFVVPLHR